VPADPAGHYFDPTPAASSRPSTVELVLPDTSFTLQTDRGVFSGEGVDPGTKLLLLEGGRPAPDGTGDLLDVGCGYGPIALTLARRAPGATVWAVDVNERARALTVANAETAGLANVRVCAPDDVPGDVRFAGIWSNPPIRIGKPALHGLLERWLGRLDDDADDAAAWLVVHKHLGSDSLARWLDSIGHPTTRLASRSGYRILEVR
jgi:16S rRNA (guanine1207-N2)-methyltransferase